MARGITPACAGNRIVTAMPDGVVRDHPRLRGEQHADPWHKCKRGGSPPLARGTDRGGGGKKMKLRITPACAGNSFCPSPLPCGRWDHPRLRGEQCSSNRKRHFRIGSPPLARGTATSTYHGLATIGITPACAGNSCLCLCLCLCLWDHPRLRGEQQGV